MENVPKEISLNEFMKQYASDKDKDTRKFCFILGAGASKQSNIPTGAELAQKWLEEINDKYDKKTVTDWMANIGLNHENTSEKYSDIYEKRFEINKQEGYFYLEKIMESAEPSFGYSVLAQILEKTQDNLIITTNFDNLLESAMFIYTQKRPLILGHESLAGYIKIFSKRPIIVKIHRDLLLNPKNSHEETGTMEKSWEENLSVVLQYYTPLVIGYGGNDGSLMNFLSKQNCPSSGMFWFYWEEGGLPSKKILDLLLKYDGYLVPIKGFDELMLKFNQVLNYKLFDDELKNIAQKRMESYRKQLESINSNEKTSAEVKDMILDAAKKQKKSPWLLIIEIENEKDIEKKNEMFRSGIEEFKNNVEFVLSYISFLLKIKMDYTEADKYYKRVLELEPNNAINIETYAIFLSEQKKDYSEAEVFYKKALELDPKNARNTENYAVFLTNHKKDYTNAEVFYKRALELDPNEATNTGNYAVFLENQINDYAEAEVFYKRALKLDPKNARISGNYAIFLTNQKKDYAEAEVFYKKALELDPKDARNTGNYANFLETQKKDYAKAEVYYKKALDLDPKHANTTGNYAKLLIEAEKYEEAEKLVDKAFELNQNEETDLLIEVWYYRYAIYDKWYEEAEKEISSLLKKGIRSVGWNLDTVYEKAIKLGHKNPDKLLEFKNRMTQEEEKT